MTSRIKKLNTKCNKCNILINRDNLVKNRRCCKTCFHRSINKKPIIPHHYLNNNIENDSKANRHIIVGASNCGKTVLMLGILKDYNSNDVYIICRSKNQYLEKYLNQSQDIEDIEFYENSHVIFDDMLGCKEANHIDQFFTRSRHNNINVFYITQSWYAIPKNTVRVKASIIYIFQQSKQDTQSLYNDIAGFDMSRQEFYSFCRDAWSEPYNYIKIDRKKQKHERYSIHNVKNSTYIQCVPETNPI